MSAPQRPEISYPCRWSYRLIGRRALEVRAAVATIVGQQEYELSESNASSGGKYLSFELALSVSSDTERTTLFSRLAEHIDILYVL